MVNLQRLLDETVALPGLLGVALVETSSGLPLGTAGPAEGPDLGLAAAGATEMVRAQQRALEVTGIPGGCHEILSTLPATLHVVRPVAEERVAGCFLYAIVDRATGDLTAARQQLTRVESELVL